MAKTQVLNQALLVRNDNIYAVTWLPEKTKPGDRVSFYDQEWTAKEVYRRFKRTEEDRS